MDGMVLTSGVSGLLGTALRQALQERQQPVLQLVRGVARRPGQLTWNPAARPAIPDAGALEGCAAAFHLSGANVAGRRWTAAYRREMTASRVETTRALAEALAGLRSRPRVLVAASAVGIYGDRGGEMLDESSAPGEGFLAELCRAWEEATKPAEDAGIRVVHARFGVVLSRNGGALAKMLPAFCAGLGGRLGNGRQWMSLVSLDDAVRALLFAAENETVRGAMNVTAPEPATNAAFTRALARRLHRPAIFPAPAFALRLAFGQMADEALLTSQRAVPRKLLDAGFRFAHPDVNAALAAALG
ncbi:MAG TPA: TIGR01777 family oxidoreductase [Terracidiphilus sp.]|nr:TIGR01777 family oxidoreductase [Terracidiphilus sp.]